MIKTLTGALRAYPKGIKKLEIGSGNNPQRGYVHLDIQSNLPKLDILGDVRKMPLPDNFVSGEIRAVHIMEHFCHPEFSGKDLRKKYGTVTEVLAECYRVLKPGGKLRIVTPDFQKIGLSNALHRIDVSWLQRWSVGGHLNEYDVHHWLWTKADAQKWFSEAGFKNLTDWNPTNYWKRKLLLQWKTKNQQSQAWYDVEWYHWLFFEGTK